jgi:hypothetical protein
MGNFLSWVFEHRYCHHAVQDQDEELRRRTQALSEVEDSLHELGLDEAHKAQAEAEETLAEAHRKREALRAVASALRAGPQEDRFAQGMEESFKQHRRQEGTP